MSLYSRLDRLAADVEKLNRQVTAVANSPQSQRTSVEGGSIDFNDADGNLMAIMGGQDDGSNTIRHVDGPTPPVPSGLSAHVDGPIVQVSWDGSFEDADTATYDWSHLEVIVVGPGNEQLTATINDVTGATANLAATVSGEWTVVARSVSRAERRSLDGDAGTVEVKLVDIDGAIEAVQDSANGKNKVTYSEHAPTPADPGIFDDTWFVGQVGRPNDIVEATNLVPNPSFELGISDWAMTRVALSQQEGAGGHVAYQASVGGGTGYVRTYPYLRGQSGSFVAVSATVKPEAGTGMSVGMIWYSGGTTGYVGEVWSPVTYGTSETRLSVSSISPNNGDYFAAAVRLYSSTGGNPSSGNSGSFDKVVAASGSSLDAAEAKVATYFDGDTPSGDTDNEPHYRWTGEPHASTSEKYLPALNIGDSDNWNVIEQYRHDGTGWVKVELSHHVFSTVDLGKATVGELDGIRIMGQTVRGEQLSGDAIDGKVITGGTYRTTGGTGSWSDAGLFIAQPDGTSMVRFPTDGSPLSLTASDVQIDRASVTDLDLSFGSVRSGGQVTLASGVTAPASPPELAAGWKLEAKLQRPPEQSMDWRGLAYWNGLYVRGVNVLGSAGDPYDRIELYNPDGSLNRSIQLDVNPQHGVAVIGDTVYTMGNDHNPANTGKNWVHGFNLNTGERVVRWEFTRNVSNQFGVGTDGTNLVFAAVGASGPLYVTRFVPATGASAGVDLITTEWVKYTSDVQGVHISGSNLWVSHREAVRKFTFSGSTITYTGTGWTNPNKNAGGFTFVDGAPLVVDSGAVYRGSTSASDYTREMCFTWYDGTHETTASPVASVDVGARETVTISLPSRTGLQKRLYSRSAGSSGNWSRSVVPADVTVSPAPVGIAVFTPPSTNTFPNADPATLKSTNDKFEVRGDGSGKWGPLTFNADGTMTSTQIPEWIPVTSFLNGAGAHTFGFTPAYRVWPDGKVEWRGVVGTGGILLATDVITVPVAARPAQAAYFTSNGTSGRLAAVDICSAEGPTTIRAGRNAAGDLAWFSLDGIYYYKS